jgi:hypothetical protein
MDSARWPRQATRAVWLSQWTYWCSLATAALSVHFVPAGSMQTIVLLVPTLTAALCLSLAYWLYESCDEYLRSAVLRCVVRTAMVVSTCTVAYFIAELAGAPKLSMLWINLLGWSVFNAQFVFVVLRSR